MSHDQRNGLAEAASAYLRSAQHQPVQWQEWGEAAFQKAKAENKPVLLDIGAVWCHWCHVMDRESYENPDIAAMINELFVPIKVDRDERPDVDTRYQAAVAAISGQGGWPLTAFLTPEGHPYFGGTYFPPEERYGRPGFPRVLASMAESWRSRRDEVEESGSSVLTAIEEAESFTQSGPALDRALLTRLAESMLQQFDARNGGFGSQPKFPHPAALDLLIDLAGRPGPLAARAREAVTVTLHKMAAGGIHDQLAGGFHRYSVDERWAVPHFEKMSYDNSELLRVYTHAFQSFLDPRFAKTAAGIIAWMDAALTDRERGGFYAAQDADESLNDDGDFYTWTLDEARAALSPEEFEAATLWFNLRAIGDMHHNPAKNVLHRVTDLPALANRLGRTEDDTRTLVTSATAKLLEARNRRPIPFVDRTVYTGWNGLCISAYLAAGRALALPEATAFALRSLDRILAEAWDPESGLQRVVRYGEAANPLGATPRVAAVLDDYVAVGMAALDAWEATGQLRYFTFADTLVHRLLHRFRDAENHAFFDTDQLAQLANPAPLGALKAKRKPVQDAPTPAGNSLAASLLLRLHALTGDPQLLEYARETLEAFSGMAEHLSLYAASYTQALQRFLNPPTQVCILGEDDAARTLEAASIAGFLLNKSVIRLRPEQLNALPPALAETLLNLPKTTQSTAILCHGTSCDAPIYDPQTLVERLSPTS